MRSMQPKPKYAVWDNTASEAYTISITVKDVDTVLKDLLSTQTEQYLRGAAMISAT